MYFVFCSCSKRSVGGGSVLRLHQRHHRLQAAGGFWQVAQLSSGPLNYFKIVICPIFRGIISRRSAAVRARGQWLVRTGVEWDSVGALTLARPGMALSWEARGAWLVSALLSTTEMAFLSPCAVNCVCLIYVSRVLLLLCLMHPNQDPSPRVCSPFHNRDGFSFTLCCELCLLIYVSGVLLILCLVPLNQEPSSKQNISLVSALLSTTETVFLSPTTVIT